MKKENETKKCKYCQSDIPEKAKVCPNCKRTLKSAGCLTYILSFIAVIVITIMLASFFSDNLQREVSGVKNDSEYITMEEYNNIKVGMTYEEVVDIVGSAGSLSSEVSTNGITMKIYTWYGNGLSGSSANVTFKNGEVEGKAQLGLK